MSPSDQIALAGLAISVIGLLITIVVERHHIAAAFRWISSKCSRLPPISFSRRRILVVAVFGLAYPIICRIRAAPAKCSNTSIPESLLANAKSGVLHHPVICSGHLPAMGNTCPAGTALTEWRIHGSKHVYISFVLSKNATDNAKEELLVEAIKSNPLSTHLYSPLIGLWGKTKQFDKIHDFLDANVEYLKSRIDSADLPEKAKARYKRAYQELSLRQSQAKRLARIAAITSK